MQLLITQMQGNGFTEVTAEHKGERVTFTTATYGKVKLNDQRQVFNDINRYWQYMDQNDPTLGDRVWNCYREIKDYIDNSIDTFHITRYVKHHIREMFEAMTMDSLSKWLLTQGGLYIPRDIEDKITTDSRYPRADQTYLTEDYINLSVLSLALRPVLPIWGEFIDPTRQGNTNDLYKEMEAVALIAESAITEWPSEKPAFTKLLTYITIATEDAPIALGNLWRGIGSSELPIWLLSKVLVRRLTIVPLCDHNATHSIIANVYNYAKSTMVPADRRTSDRVNEKLKTGDGADEDDKTSFVEAHKVKQRVATGDVELYNVYSLNVHDIVKGVDPTINLGLVDDCLKMINRTSKLRIFDHQVLLAQWVLGKKFAPRAIRYIHKLNLHHLLAGAQALLWHWGFLDLACLMQVDHIVTTDQDIPGITHRPRGGSRISRKYDDDLNTLYPHVKPQKLTPRNPTMDTNSRSSNFAVACINALTRHVYRYDWYYYGPNRLIKQSDQPEGKGLLVLPPKLKDQITELVIHIAKLNQ